MLCYFLASFRNGLPVRVVDEFTNCCNIRQRFLKKIREEKYIRVFAEEYLIDSSNGDHLDYELFVEKINQIIDLLPPRRREIFILSYKEELKNHEIARKLGLSDHTIKKQLVIARKFIVGQARNPVDWLVLYSFVFSSDKARTKKEKLLLIDHSHNWQKVLAQGDDIFLEYIPDGIHPSDESGKNIIAPMIINELEK